MEKNREALKNINNLISGHETSIESVTDTGVDTSDSDFDSTKSSNSEPVGTLTKDRIAELMPKGINVERVTDEVVAVMNNLENDTGLVQDYMEEQVFMYFPIMKDMKVPIEKYVNAIKFCNMKRKVGVLKAWSIVFKDQYNRLIEKGMDASANASMYNSSKLVVKIDTEMVLDIRIQYAPVLHKAIKKEVQLMEDDSVSAHVQHLAAKTLIETLVPLEEQKVDIKIGMSEEAKKQSGMIVSELEKIAKMQQERLMKGESIEDVQKLNVNLIGENNEEDDEEYIDVDTK